MKRENQKGAALVLTIILIAVLSVMTVSMMFLSQSEGWSTANYRLMSAARDGAEAGLNRAANFLVGATDPSTGKGAPQNSGAFTYTAPTAVSAFTQSGNTSPVTWSDGKAVGLASSNVDVPSSLNMDYETGTGITAGVKAAFIANVPGTLTLGSSATGVTTVNYGAYAELLSIKNLGTSSLLCGGGAGSNTLERWRITGQGSVVGVQGAVEQVSAIIDRPTVSCSPVGAYATSNTCGTTFNGAPLSFNGGGITDSYDSSISGCSAANIGTTAGAGGCGLLNSGGNVGTNGSAFLGNSATINGSVYEPRNGATGSGNCSPATSGGGSVTGSPSLQQEAQVPSYPPPATPTPAPTNGNETFQQPNDCTSHATVCTRLRPGGTYLPGDNGTNSDTRFKLIPTCTPAVIQCGTTTTGTYQNLTLQGSNTYDMCPGTYNVNSIALGANATLKIHQSTDADFSTYCNPTTSGPVYINVLGTGNLSGGNAIDFSSGTLSNPSMSATNFQILYAGTAGVSLKGNAGAAALVYAPLAAVSISGSGTYYGAIVGSTIRASGGASIAYDRSLSSNALQPGNPMMQAFTWKKF